MIAFERTVRCLRLIAWASPVALMFPSVRSPIWRTPSPAPRHGRPRVAAGLAAHSRSWIACKSPTSPDSALAAARAAWRPSEAGYRGVMGLRAPDSSPRTCQFANNRQVEAAARAELCQTEYDTTYAIIRMYYSAVYARQQVEVTNDVVGNLGSGRSGSPRHRQSRHPPQTQPGPRIEDHNLSQAGRVQTGGGGRRRRSRHERPSRGDGRG